MVDGRGRHHVVSRWHVRWQRFLTRFTPEELDATREVLVIPHALEEGYKPRYDVLPGWEAKALTSRPPFEDADTQTIDFVTEGVAH
jgi:hypothetical protein